MNDYCEKCFYPISACVCQECKVCKKSFPPNELYEYRGIVACNECIDSAREKRDFERQEVIEESRHKTDRFRGLDLGDNAIGRANREILKKDIEIAKKESGRIKEYERPGKY